MATDAHAYEVSVFYHDAKTELYKLVEGPLLVDTAKGGFVVDRFDPARTSPPYDTFKVLPVPHVSEDKLPQTHL